MVVQHGGSDVANESTLAVRIPLTISQRLAALVPLVDSDTRFALTGGSGQGRVARIALLYGIERLETELRNPGLFPPSGPSPGKPVNSKKKG